MLKAREMRWLWLLTGAHAYIPVGAGLVGFGWLVDGGRAYVRTGAGRARGESGQRDRPDVRRRLAPVWLLAAPGILAVFMVARVGRQLHVLPAE